MNIINKEKETNTFNAERKGIMIFVKTYIQEPGNCKEILSNLFSFCFIVPKPKRAIPRVVPLTYQESMNYLQGKRELDQTTRIAIQSGSTFAQYL